MPELLECLKNLNEPQDQNRRTSILRSIFPLQGHRVELKDCDIDVLVQVVELLLVPDNDSLIYIDSLHDLLRDAHKFGIGDLIKKVCSEQCRVRRSLASEAIDKLLSNESYQIENGQGRALRCKKVLSRVLKDKADDAEFVIAFDRLIFLVATITPKKSCSGALFLRFSYSEPLLDFVSGLGEFIIKYLIVQT